MNINTSASGKAFLSGEYMAMEGGRAILLSTTQKARVTISNNNEKHNLFITSMSEYEYPFELDNQLNFNWLNRDPEDLGKILEYAIIKFNKNFSGKTIYIDSSEFFFNDKKIGIGSSAAVSVSVTKALNELFQLKYDQKQVIDFSKAIHYESQKSIVDGVYVNYKETQK